MNKIKSAILALSVLALITLAAGCAVGGSRQSPVPTTHLLVKIGGQTVSLDNPKDTTLTNLTVRVETNGTVEFSVGSLQSANNSNVVGSAYAGQADLINALGTQLNNAAVNGSKIAGTVLGAAVKTP